jgi:hypothetical protein
MLKNGDGLMVLSQLVNHLVGATELLALGAIL